MCRITPMAAATRLIRMPLLSVVPYIAYLAVNAPMNRRTYSKKRKYG